MNRVTHTAIIATGWLFCAASIARAELNLSVAAADPGVDLRVGRPATFFVELSGLADGAELDSLSATVRYNGALLSKPVIKEGNILPRPLDDPFDFLTAEFVGEADASFLTFGTDVASHISSNGTFFSFEVTPLKEGTGRMTFDVNGTNATVSGAFDALRPALVDTGPPAAFTVLTPEPTALALALSAVFLLAIGVALNRTHKHVRYTRRLAVEPLEHRQLLSGQNVLSEFVGWVDRPEEIEAFDATVTPEMVSLQRDMGVFGIHVRARNGGDLDPAPVQLARPDGSAVTPTLVRSNIGRANDSVVVVDLRAGDYVFSVLGEEGSFGPFHMDIFLAGDANGDHIVDRRDAEVIRRSYGAEMGDDAYRLAADANLDGRITAFDLAQWKRNARNSAPAGRIGPPTFEEYAASASESLELRPARAGGVYDKVPAVVPQEGFESAAPMRFFESEIGLVQPLASLSSGQGGVYEVPGTNGPITVTFTWEFREAAYDNEVGIYFVNDLNGSVSALDPQNPDLLPGDAGYTAAALDASNVDVIFAGGTDPNGNGPVVETRSMTPGTLFSFYMVQDNSTSSGANGQANVWFALQNANADDYAHFQETQLGDPGHRSDCVSLKVEDLRNADTGIPNAPAWPGGPPITGNDMDYNDVVISYDDSTDAPKIINFAATEGPTVWTFDGKVIDNGNVEGLVVDFGGILEGETATVDKYGDFLLMIELPNGTYGTATARTTDTQGLVSEVVGVTI